MRPGGGRDGAVMFLGGRGTFHSSWAREVFVTEPGDHVDLGSLFLATHREREEDKEGDASRKWNANTVPLLKANPTKRNLSKTPKSKQSAQAKCVPAPRARVCESV